MMDRPLCRELNCRDFQRKTRMTETSKCEITNRLLCNARKLHPNERGMTNRGTKIAVKEFDDGAFRPQTFASLYVCIRHGWVSKLFYYPGFELFENSEKIPG